jgi:hypothetical protein
MPLCMMAMGDDCEGALERLACSGRHEGILVRTIAALDEEGT